MQSYACNIKTNVFKRSIISYVISLITFGQFLRLIFLNYIVTEMFLLT